MECLSAQRPRASRATREILLCEGGDVIVTWQDSRSGHYDIYAQRFDGDGNPLWTIDGVAVCTAANDQNIPDIVSDDADGAIIAWEDRRNGKWDIYAQRIDPDGNILWATEASRRMHRCGETRCRRELPPTWPEAR